MIYQCKVCKFESKIKKIVRRHIFENHKDHYRATDSGTLTIQRCLNELIDIK